MVLWVWIFVIILAWLLTEWRCNSYSLSLSLWLESGQQALIDADGIRILYFACQEAIECTELESLICMASAIVRKCFPRCHLPVASLQNPLVFNLTALECANNYSRTKTTQSTCLLLLMLLLLDAAIELLIWMISRHWQSAVDRWIE